MIAMPRPIPSKVLLVADRRTATPESGAAPLRRFRLARVRFDSRAAGPARFDHLKRVYE